MTFWKIDYPSGSFNKTGYTNAEKIEKGLRELGLFRDSDGIISKWTEQEIQEDDSVTEEDAVKKDGGKHVFKKDTWITEGCKEEKWCTKGLKDKLISLNMKE